MKYTQNDKIKQITPETLIIGVDIASVNHYARAFDFRGIEYGKVLMFSNDATGFEAFRSWIGHLLVEGNMRTVLVVMEPTGHYWFNLAQYLDDQGMKTALVNPYHVKRSKELDDNSPTKNDQKDPKTIAMLAKDGRYLMPYIPKGIFSDLRVAMENRSRIAERLNGVANRVKRWLSIYFPEFNAVFAKWDGKTALVCLREFSTPALVLEQGVNGIVESWKEKKIRGEGNKRATRLFEAAQRSVGVREGQSAALLELEVLLEEYDLLTKQVDRAMAFVKDLVSQIPGANEVINVKGLGLVTVAGFLAEIGDPSRFSHPKQIQKFAGLNLKENSSGKHQGKTTITKRGRRRLRAILFRAIMPMVATNAEFKQLHKYYTTRSENPLKKMQSLVALMCKLIRVMFAMLTKNVAYDGQKMLQDIHRPTEKNAA